MAIDQTPEELLKRAYSLETEQESLALYRDWAQSYDATMLDGLRYVTPRKTASLLFEALQETTARILDVGSGTGLAGEHLARLGFSNIDALDYSPEMLDVAEMRTVEGNPVYTNTVLADLNQKLDLETGCYGAMICTGTFTHAHVGSQCLDELFRLLKQGGLFACTVHQDVWEEAGFAAKIKELASGGVMRTCGMTMGTFYETDDEPQGWYIVWEKL